MRKSAQLRCSCVHCDQFIEYSPEEVGQIAECPSCKQKSLLPPAPEPAPPPPEEPEFTPHPAPRARSYSPRPRPSRPAAAPKIWIVLGAVLVLVLGGVLALRFLKKPAPTETTPPIVSQAPPGPIPQPKVKRARSLNDLKIGTFTIQPQRDSEVRIVSGDIENDSESLHRNLKVELDLHDSQGLKVASLEAFVTELVPHGVWHVLTQTTEARAASVRVVGLREVP